MTHGKRYIVLIKLAIIATIVVAGSLSSNKIWKHSDEAAHQIQSIAYDEVMTVAEFGKKNTVPVPVLKKTFGLRSQEDLQMPLGNLPFTQDEVRSKIRKNLVLHAEHGSKNWKKILVKFGCWIAFLCTVFFMLRNVPLTNAARITLYSIAVLIFGIILGSDPGPMGTIKDTIVLFGSERVIFPPRMIALVLFLLMVVLANKFICSWGCQVGTLQDLLFRINRRDKDTSILHQYRIPFAVSNMFRIAFSLLFVAVAMVWATDIIAPIDPFKVFNPKMLGLIGSISVGMIMFLSVFIYRPWCHLFCPFGLLGWFFERISLFKIRVDYNKCIACEACAKACPSTAMNTILKRDKIIPDCFSCGSCIAACPTQAISLRAGKRERPPTGKFDSKIEQHVGQVSSEAALSASPDEPST
jgi:ferredoxin